MELYKGLPLRTIETETKEGSNIVFGVTTEEVNDLINNFFLDSLNENLDDVTIFEEFDNSYSYAIPQEVFEDDDDNVVINYINENIDIGYLKEIV